MRPTLRKALAGLVVLAASLPAQPRSAGPPLSAFGYERVLREIAVLLPGGSGRAAPRDGAPRELPALSASQAAQLVPLVQRLRDNPYPTPALAREVLAGLDSILSDQQREALARLPAPSAREGQRPARALGARGGAGATLPGGGSGARGASAAAAEGARNAARAAAVDSQGAPSPESMRQSLASALLRRLQALATSPGS